MACMRRTWFRFSATFDTSPSVVGARVPTLTGQHPKACCDRLFLAQIAFGRHVSNRATVSAPASRRALTTVTKWHGFRRLGVA